MYLTIRGSFDVVGSLRSDDAESVGVLLDLDRSDGMNIGQGDQSKQAVLLPRVRAKASAMSRLDRGSDPTHLVTFVHGDLTASEHEPPLLPSFPSLALLHQVAALDCDTLAQSGTLSTEPQLLFDFAWQWGDAAPFCR